MGNTRKPVASPGGSSAELLQGRELIGRGFNSDVYAWGDGRVLKLFHAGIARTKAEQEYLATRAIHATGLPVPFVFEVLEVERRFGVVFERVEGISLLRQTQARPWTMFQAIRQMAELHAQVHQHTGPAELPSQRERLAAKIERASDLSTAERTAALKCLADLPDGTALCHGDFHPENILLTARGPIVIDWEGATRGHALGDVACTWRLIQNAGLPPWSPTYMHLILICTRPLMHRCYLKRYFQLQPGTRQEVDAWQLPLAAAVTVRRDPSTPA